MKGIGVFAFSILLGSQAVAGDLRLDPTKVVVQCVHTRVAFRGESVPARQLHIFYNAPDVQYGGLIESNPPIRSYIVDEREFNDCDAEMDNLIQSLNRAILTGQDVLLRRSRFFGRLSFVEAGPAESAVEQGTEAGDSSTGESGTDESSLN